MLRFARLGLLLTGTALAVSALLAPPAAAAIAPTVQFRTAGLGARDVVLGVSSAPVTVTLRPGDVFTASASTTTAGATVAVVGDFTTRCSSSDGIGSIAQGSIATPFGPSPATYRVNVASFGCNAGYLLDSVELHLWAEARTAFSESSTAAATFLYSPWQQVVDATFSVPEAGGPANGWTDTGINVQPGERLVITGSGEIWAGWWFTGTNGPEGWDTPAGADYPLPGAPAYGLIGNLGDTANGPKFHIGRSLDEVPSINWASRLYLRTNDNVPGNGSGAFSARVRVYHHA